MVINSQIDTIYHEHISFFNVRSMQEIVKRSGLYLTGLEITPIHGNSYIWYITKKQISIPQQQYLFDRLQIEEQQGLFQKDRYLQYAKDAFELRRKVTSQISAYSKNGYKIVVYGAAAKGNTFLNFCQIRVDHIYDDNDLKIGKYSPICNVIVEHPGNMADLSSKLVFIITSWNFYEEILKKIKALRGDNEDLYLLYYPEFIIGKIND